VPTAITFSVDETWLTRDSNTTGEPSIPIGGSLAQQQRGPVGDRTTIDRDRFGRDARANRRTQRRRGKAWDSASDARFEDHGARHRQTSVQEWFDPHPRPTHNASTLLRPRLRCRRLGTSEKSARHVPVSHWLHAIAVGLAMHPSPRVYQAALMTLRIVADVNEDGTTIRLNRPHAGGTRRVCAARRFAVSRAPAALDLEELTLADVEAVRFFVAAERQGIVLDHCAPFIREWMSREATDD